MGAPMATRLIGASYDVLLFDVNREAILALDSTAEARAASLAQICATCDVVFLSLPSPQAVVEAATAVSVDGSKVRIVVDLSTSGPATAVALGEKLRNRRIELVDAPVSGGIAGARAGTLSLLVSGSAAAVAAVAPALRELGKIFEVGTAPGAGQTMKLVNNLLNACAMAITAEGMALGVKAGLDPARMIEVLNASTGRNSATQDKWPRSVLPRTFDYGFATGLCLKDVRLCMDEAARLGVPLGVGAAVLRALERTAADYGLESDFTALARLAEADGGLVADTGARQ
jgi:3-hydroxyisobutyrate dehydrogenase-like beta-hydroxyacid dehydrogenase